MLAVCKTVPEPGLDIKEVQRPKPSSQEVLVKIMSAGICGSDLHMYNWTPSYYKFKDSLPLILGHEASGVVVEAGSDQCDLKVNDRVVCMPGLPCEQCLLCRNGRPELCENFQGKMLGLSRDGVFAEYLSIPEKQCLLIPKEISFDEAALIEPLVVAANAYELSEIKMGESVVILGPGSIGLIVLLLARASGAGQVTVVGTDDDAYRLELAREMGATKVISVKRSESDNETLRSKGCLDADVVFEATGSSTSVYQGLEVLKKGGKLIILGIHARDVSLNYTKLVREGKSIIGSYSGSAMLFARMIEFLKHNDSEAFSNLITHRFTFDQAEEAFQTSQSKKSGKVIFTQQ